MGISASRKPAPPPITAQDKAILDLKVQRDKLRQYQKKVILDRETAIAKQALKQNDQRRALLALKKKKLQTVLLQRTDAQLVNVEQLVASIEFARVEQAIVQGLAKGAEVLKQLQKEMTLEDVERIMDDTAEGIAYQEELSAALGTELSPDDEQAVLDELAMIEQEAIIKLPNVPDTVPDAIIDKLPSVPNDQVSIEDEGIAN